MPDPRPTLRTAVRWWAAAALALLLLLGPVAPAGAQDGGFAHLQPAFEWRLAFKLINVTARGERGDAGYLRAGDDTREQNAQRVRLQLQGRPVGWLDYQFDYLNVKRDVPPGTAVPQPDAAVGADRFRYKSWRRTLEEPEPGPGGVPSTQQVLWSDEIDRAFVTVHGGAVDASIGRQPLTWGAGRIWQPTDVFSAFAPVALDTEYKPGIDAVVLRGYPGAFTVLSAAYVLSPRDAPVNNSAVAHLRTRLGESTEVTALAGAVREARVAGGSVETTWLRAGWRLETLAYEAPDGGVPRGALGDREHFAVAGVDYGLSGGTLLLAEWYRNSAGAVREADVPAIVTDPTFGGARLPQLARDVLALGAEDTFGGLWTAAYTLFGTALEGPDGTHHSSLLHQGTLTYSISDNAEAVFSLLRGTGRGLDPATGLPRSEYGALPTTLYVRLQFVL